MFSPCANDKNVKSMLLSSSSALSLSLPAAVLYSLYAPPVAALIFLETSNRVGLLSFNGSSYK